MYVSDLELKAKEVTSGVFGALAKCIKNLNVKEDPTLVMDVMAELKKVDGECVPPMLEWVLWRCFPAAARPV